MPDSPAVSFFQLSALPAPSDVTTPMPVTTTIGLPNLSRGAVMFSPPALQHDPKKVETGFPKRSCPQKDNAEVWFNASNQTLVAQLIASTRAMPSPRQ
jgi:hypothetical protein